MKTQSLTAIIAITTLICALPASSWQADGAVVVDEEFGFRLEVPPGFEPADPAPLNDNNVLRLFVKGLERTGEKGPAAIFVRRLRVAVPSGSRVTQADLDAGPDRSISIDSELRWKELTLDVMRAHGTDEGRELVTFSAVLPLEGEAISVSAQGDLDKEDRLRDLLHYLVGKFENLKPLEPKPGFLDSLNAGALGRMTGGTMARCAILLGVIIVVRMLFKFVNGVFGT